MNCGLCARGGFRRGKSRRGSGGERGGPPRALAAAKERDLDLVEVDPHGSPPVCRLLDFGTWRYQQAKKEREGRKHQKGLMVHEVRMRPHISGHDMERKVRLAERFLREGDRVKVTVMLRGREGARPEA